MVPRLLSRLYSSVAPTSTSVSAQGAAVLGRLRERSLVANITSGAFPEPGSAFYIGFDPTAPSLHVGNLLGIIVSTHLRLAGYRPILLVGGATARAGDPSFRESAKVRLDDATIRANATRIGRQLGTLMTNGLGHAARHQGYGEVPDVAVNVDVAVAVVDNYEWQRDIRLLDFLDGIGSNMRLGPMLSRESVQRRLETGMSFTEFAYQLLQGYDFYHLFTRHGCRLQLGGSDQWGNIVAGVEMIGRCLPERAHEAAALTFPLLTTAGGEKMGKSAGNAVWLDPRMTSPFDMYQYFVRLADADCPRLLQLMTFLPQAALRQLQAEHARNPEDRQMQKTLAYEVTAFAHGASEADAAVRASALLFDRYDEALASEADRRLLAAVLQQSGRRRRLTPEPQQQQQQGATTALAVMKQLMPDQSNGALKTLARAGGIYINGRRTENLHDALVLPDPTFVRVGKHTHFLIEH